MTVRNESQRRNRLASALAASLVIGGMGTFSGCSSSLSNRVASLNPFGGKETASSQSESSGWLDGPKNVASKSRDTVAGWFGGKKELPPDVIPGDETDPTSLAHKAEVSPEVFVANGRLWESTGNFEKAMESYAKALEKRPNDPAALANIARLHFRQNNHQKAAEYFGKAIKEKPDDAGLYNDLGLTLSKLGNHSAAATTIEQALRLSPGSSRFANNLASVKFEAGDTNGALEVLVGNNKPAVAHFNMAYLHYKHGQASEATRHLNQALAFQPQAASDAATKRAVDRSRELLAQIGSVPGATGGSVPGAAGTAIAAAPPTSSPAVAQTQAQAATAGPAGVQRASQGLAAGNTTTGVQPASTGTTDVNFGNASFRTSTPTQTAPTNGTGSQFVLPPNTQLP